MVIDVSVIDHPLLVLVRILEIIWILTGFVNVVFLREDLVYA